ncbi:PEP-CTERM sorting domain-containing protein [Alteromonas sp. BL110]|uniref:nidogen-like domain-containing protein n=1 Tax=Alteromonas sp. BL110 TaxID=1714845 RepID=UPI000E4960F6|nr:nidogen-like domain-containing protein [Alteromonas sp. BL110]AXT39928.1 PEP-CTERM sorting domain-containing protein [Alteromonas sp. BL110]RKM79157.1 PEP-CTERM sorting domain-containing protein [Alteromonas sp. BL110]
MSKPSRFKLSLLASAALAFSISSTTANASVLLSGWEGSTESRYGNLAMNSNDDGSSGPIVFNTFEALGFDNGVNFFGTSYDRFFINNNGNITFNGPVGTFTPDAFPNNEQPMIAPFWGDVDTRCGDCGGVFIGSPNEDTLVVTWNDVGYYDQNSNPTNTFQLVLIDREDTGAGNFDVEFRYEDIGWTSGEASSGVPAQAGYDAGDGENFFTVPGSQTAAIADIDESNSNTGTPGIWKFAIRDGVLPGENPENPILPIVNPETPTDYEFEFSIDDPDELVFIDPDVAVGYDYIVNSGPNIASVLLPEGYDDNLFDLFLWDDGLMDWLDTGTDIAGGVEYDFTSPVDRFRIMGIDVSNMLEPTPDAFVTGLTFDGSGVINMNQNAVTVFVPDPTQVPAPSTLFLMLGALFSTFLLRKRK